MMIQVKCPHCHREIDVAHLVVDVKAAHNETRVLIDVKPPEKDATSPDSENEYTYRERVRAAVNRYVEADNEYWSARRTRGRLPWSSWDVEVDARDEALNALKELVK